nr:MAG TPA: hypothetical protein [Caudoviricetes sp.]
MLALLRVWKTRLASCPILTSRFRPSNLLAV